MRRIIVLAAFLYLSILVRAQPYIPAVRFVSADPSGSCSNSPPLRYNYTNGKLWGCENGTWTQINGGGSGSGTVTSVSAGNLSPIFNSNVATPTSTPALTFTLINFGQNAFLAGPSTGGAGAPTVRAITCNDQPALTGDTTTSAGSCATTTAKINGTAFPTSAAVVGSNGSAQPIAATTTGTGSTAVLSASPALTGVPTTPTATAGDNTTQIATDAFVTTAVNNAIAGVNPAVAVNAATTAAGDTSGLTYNNGVSGVGATFTGTTNTAITIDGVTFTTVGQRLLVKNDTQSPSGAFNGIYSFTQLQTGLLPPIFTRALDYDQPSDMNNTGAIPVIGGTANISTSWLLTSSVVTVGVTPLTFTKFSINPATIPTLAGPNTFTGQSTLTGGSFGAASQEYEVSFCASGCTNPAITQAQITAANVTAVSLIPALGAGTMIVVDNAAGELVFNNAAFAGTGVPELVYTNASGPISAWSFANTCVVVTSTAACGFGKAAGGASGVSSTLINQPLVLFVSGTITCSTTCGTLALWIKYRVLTGL